MTPSWWLVSLQEESLPWPVEVEGRERAIPPYLMLEKGEFINIQGSRN